MRIKTETKNFFIFLLAMICASIPPAFAYGGPGAAIGAIIVLITIIIAFFSSLIIKILNLIKVSFSKLRNYLKSNKKRKIKK